MHFPFETVEDFSNSKSRPPGSENVRIPGVSRGWSDLELTATLCQNKHFSTAGTISPNSKRKHFLDP